MTSEVRHLLKRFLNRRLSPSPESHVTSLAASPDVALKLRSLLLLRAFGFPTDQIHEVLGCPREEVDTCVEEIDRYFSTSDEMHRFLAHKADPAPIEADEPAKPQPENPLVPKAPGAAAPSDVPDVARDALEVLEYWTSRWFDDLAVDAEKKG